MAVRIYSLAKDLGVDSKELVDMCARIGIQGKGSALASLEDDEIAKIKNHLAERSAPASEVSKESPKPVREPIKDAPIRELSKPATPKREIGGIRRPTKTSDDTTDEALEEPIVAKGLDVDMVSEPEVVQAQPAQSLDPNPPVIRVDGPEGDTSEQQDEAFEPQDVSLAPVDSDSVSTVAPVVKARDTRSEPSRDFASMNVPGKVRVIGRTRTPEVAKPAGASDAVKGVRRPREPVINLAKIPKSAAPTPAARAQEPATLKPIVKLTPEVLKGVQQQISGGYETGEAASVTCARQLHILQ